MGTLMIFCNTYIDLGVGHDPFTHLIQGYVNCRPMLHASPMYLDPVDDCPKPLKEAINQ